MVAAILFNSGGYDLFFQYLIYRSDNKVLDKINHSNYRTSDLVELKLPVDFPAQAPQEYSTEYQTVSGQIQVKNEKYDYAEIKITKDTIYLHVIPNTERNVLAKVNTQYGKQANDIPASNSKRTNNTLTKKSMSESEYLIFNYNYSPVVEIKKVSHNFTFSRINNPALEIDGQPPEA